MLTSFTSPMAPSVMRSRILLRLGLKRSSWSIMWMRPSASAFVSMAADSSWFIAIGLSHSTCAPASNAASAIGAWVSVGVAIHTRSG